MAIADELRRYADEALKEGGMYFSGAYLDGLAKRAESEQSENAKLRQQLTDVTESMGRVEERCAKLRELVRTLHHCAARGECDVCTMRDGRGLDEDTVCFAAHDRMRELGVEVDG